MNLFRDPQACGRHSCPRPFAGSQDRGLGRPRTEHPPLSRRSFVRKAGMAACAAVAGGGRAASVPDCCGMGLVAYCLGIHQRERKAGTGARDAHDAVGFLEACRDFGAGGVQFPFGGGGEASVRPVREAAERHGLHVEAIVALPKGDNDVGRFEKELSTARAAGATVARTVMLPGRRYEQFKTREAFAEACASGLEALERAEPIARRIGVRLAVENHKDHRADEKIDVLKQLDSEYVGACVDFGNNLALAEDPLEVVRALAPWALTAHIKDHAVRECPEGFWMTDVALGEGLLDLPAMVGAIRKARPAARFNLEVITRDPILVPALTPGYRETFADLGDEEIDRTMALVRSRGARESLVMVSALSVAEQVALERHNVERSVRYARERLGI